LLDQRGELTFLEMNPRIQVEHPVTELVMGVDLVAEQLRIADGQPLELPAYPLTPRGHAIECRINAEDPVTFAPSPGVISELHMAGGAGVRVDSGVYGGGRVPSHYDPLIAKLIVHAPTRARAIAKMRRALSETIIGEFTNIPLHQDSRASRLRGPALHPVHRSFRRSPVDRAGAALVDLYGCTEHMGLSRGFGYQQEQGLDAARVPSRGQYDKAIGQQLKF
jgi:hypothetical protein